MCRRMQLHPERKRRHQDTFGELKQDHEREKNADDEIQDLKRALASAHAEIMSQASVIVGLDREIETKKEFCYLCLNVVRCPLKVCAKGHVVCAECVGCQLTVTHFRQSICKDHSLPQMHCSWNPNALNHFKCGICCSVDDLQYPGSTFFRLLDSTCKNICPHCEGEFPLAELGLHVATCMWQKTKCVACGNLVSLQLLPNHFSEECSKMPCSRLTCKFQGTPKAVDTHMDQHALVDRIGTVMLKQLFYISLAQNNIADIITSFIHFCHSLQDSSEMPYISEFKNLATIIEGDDLMMLQNEFLDKLISNAENRFARPVPSSPSYSPASPSYSPGSPSYSPEQE